MEATLPCYDPAIIDRITANGYRKFAVGELAGNQMFVMQSDGGTWEMYVVVNGMVCVVANGSSLAVLPQPPNL